MTKENVEILKSKAGKFIAEVRELIPDGCDFDLSIISSSPHMEVKKWDATEPGYEGKYDDVKRREYVDVRMHGNEWGKDFSDMMNDCYKKAGVLL